MKRLTRVSGRAVMLFAHDAIVAPVVSTSSISSICLPCKASGLAIVNIPSTFFHLSSRLLCVCVSFAFVRSTQPLSTGILLTADNPLAM